MLREPVSWLRDVTEMRQLYLLRHAKSCWDDPSLDDFDRPLNKRGKKAAKLMAAHLRRGKVRPAMVLCSSARRTSETLEFLGTALDGVPVSIERDIYEAGKGKLLGRLKRLDDHLGSALLIGHNPGLARLAEALCGAHGDADSLARLAGKLPTGALLTLETSVEHWAELEEGSCQLVSFVAPADLAEGK